MSSFNAIQSGQRVLRIEADALADMAQTLGTEFERAIEILFALKGRIVLTGIGKSGHVARKIAATLASTGSPAMFVHATEASHGDLGMIDTDDAILALSKTGETRELADITAYAKRYAIPLIAMTAFADSTLGRAADLVLKIPEAAEAAAAVNAPTTSTTLQMALGDAIAVALLERRGFTPTDFREFHPGGKLGAMLKTAGELAHGAAELPLISPDRPMSEALLVMTEKRFGCVGVVGGSGDLIGMVTDGDLRRHMDGLLSNTAGDIMTRAPLTIGSGLLAAEALRILNEKRITVLFIVDDGKPVGILHLHDLLRAGVA
jgi:arabinose-5-phosphate isomerase